MTVRDITPWKKKGNDSELQKPFEGLSSLAESMDRAFEDFWAPIGSGRFGSSLLRGFGGMSSGVDIKETAKEVIVSAALPGVDKKDIHVDLTEDRLTIRAEHKEETEHKGKNKHREQSYRQFCHSFTLPAAVKSDQAKASYKDGVLRLELPKARESQVRRIEID
jgi:HSP20 family protein